MVMPQVGLGLQQLELQPDGSQIFGLQELGIFVGNSVRGTFPKGPPELLNLLAGQRVTGVNCHDQWDLCLKVTEYAGRLLRSEKSALINTYFLPPI